MGIGPVPAVRKLLARTGVTVERHRPRRAERGVRLPEPRGRARARARPSSGERQRRRDRARPPARHERRPARRRRCCTSCAAAAAATAWRRCASASARVRLRCSSASAGCVMRTQVGIVGAGPAGLLLGQLLQLHGHRVGRCSRYGAREHVERRVRAGRARAGHGRSAPRGGARRAAGPRGPACTTGIELQFAGRAAPHRLTRPDGRPDDHGLRADRGRQGPDRGAARAGGRSSSRRGRRPRSTSTPSGPVDPRPRTRAARRLECDVVAGCDGFHGVCRTAIPAGVLRTYSSGVPLRLAGHPRRAVAPSSDELVYAHHERGFALLSLRSPERQPPVPAVPPDERPRGVARRPHLGRAARSGSALRRLDAPRRARSSRRASPACAASSSSRCATGACSWPATPRTSCRRPAPRA